ncbi:MAG TPA: Fic family protein [Solirubrobacterales bacterium]|jgi:Fic family protein
MRENHVQPLDPTELAEIDAQYRPFPSFEDWPKELPSADAWEHSRLEFQEISNGAADADLKEAQAVAMRAAAFDTGAIEGLYSTDRGLTMTVATQAAAWEQEVAKQGPDARALFEAQLSAFELVLDQVTERLPKVTQAWIRRLHEEITSPQEIYRVHTPLGVQEQPLPKGEYKVYPNHVRTETGEVHAYAPVDRTQAEMQRLVDEVDSSDFRETHPVIQASYIHYALAAIHPFADGNGRVARAAASAYTYRAASVPVLVFVDRRDAYLDALAEADSGNPQRFVELLARVTQEAMELVMDSLLTAQAPQPEDKLRKLSGLYPDSNIHQQLDEAGNSVAKVLLDVTKNQINQLTLPETVSIRANRLNLKLGNPPPGFRQIGDMRGGFASVRLVFASAPPAMAEIAWILDVFISKDASIPEAVRIQVNEEPTEHLMLSFPDVCPQLSDVAKRRAENFSRRVLGQGLDALYEQARAALDEK